MAAKKVVKKKAAKKAVKKTAKKAVKKTAKKAVKKTAKKAVKKVATPVVKLATSKPFRGALNFVPGVGPVASMALSAASPTLRGLVKSGRHLPPHQRPAYHRALATVPHIPPHRHAIFTGPAVPL